MIYKPRKWKKSLTNLQHTRVLEIVGLNPIPISSTDIHNEYIRKYDPGNKNKKNSNVYEVVKDLFKPSQNKKQTDHIQQRFLKPSLKQKYIEEISQLKKLFDIDDESLDVKIHTYRDRDEEMNRTRAFFRINDLKNDTKCYRYSLNFKGFLLYLIGSYRHFIELDNNEIVKKQKYITNIYDVVKNLITREDIKDRDDIKDEFEFLKYFKIFDEIYGKKTFVKILIDISEELSHQYTRLTPEFMKYYFLRRLYDEIKIEDIVFRKLNSFSKSFIRFTNNQQEQQQLIKENEIDNEKIQNSKTQILKILIQLQEQELERMKRELNQN